MPNVSHATTTRRRPNRSDSDEYAPVRTADNAVDVPARLAPTTAMHALSTRPATTPARWKPARRAWKLNQKSLAMTQTKSLHKKSRPKKSPPPKEATVAAGGTTSLAATMSLPQRTHLRTSLQART